MPAAKPTGSTVTVTVLVFDPIMGSQLTQPGLLDRVQFNAPAPLFEMINFWFWVLTLRFEAKDRRDRFRLITGGRWVATVNRLSELSDIDESEASDIRIRQSAEAGPGTVH